MEESMTKTEKLIEGIKRSIATESDELLCDVIDEDTAPLEIFTMVWEELKSRHPRRYARYESEKRAPLSDYIREKI